MKRRYYDIRVTEKQAKEIHRAIHSARYWFKEFVSCPENRVTGDLPTINRFEKLADTWSRKIERSRRK